MSPDSGFYPRRLPKAWRDGKHTVDLAEAHSDIRDVFFFFFLFFWSQSLWCSLSVWITERATGKKKKVYKYRHVHKTAPPCWAMCRHFRVCFGTVLSHSSRHYSSEYCTVPKYFSKMSILFPHPSAFTSSITFALISKSFQCPEVLKFWVNRVSLKLGGWRFNIDFLGQRTEFQRIMSDVRLSFPSFQALFFF